MLRLYAFVRALSVAFVFSEQTMGVFFSDSSLEWVNCSQSCVCEEISLESVVERVKLRPLMGENIRRDLSDDAEFIQLIGLFSSWVHTLIMVTCKLTDTQPQHVSPLLNGMHEKMQTGLVVQCTEGQDLIWDVAPWHTSFNVFHSENCNLVPSEESKGIIVPMNLWIWDVRKGGADLPSRVNIKYTMNTVAFAISGSFVPSLPNSWKDKYMTSATVISLRDNGIEDFHCPFTLTHRLDTLNLEHNQLKRFPDCVLNSDLIKLNFLSLAFNRISDLTPVYEVSHMSPLPDILAIDLSNNQIKSIEGIRGMGKLAVLDLSFNAIKEVSDDAFLNLNSLKVLSLAHNKIHVIHAYVFWTDSSLELLDLSYNNLVAMVPDHLASQATHLTLNLQHNRLPYPPNHDCQRNKPSLSNIALYASNNPFTCDCKMADFERCLNWLDTGASTNITNKQDLYKDLYKMKCVAPEPLKGTNLLYGNFIKSCIMARECPPECDCRLEHAEHLIVNCSHRKLLEMPDTLPSYPNANVHLYLDRNPLQMLNYRSYLHGLTTLFLDNCLLTSVTPAAISALRNVKVLTLHNNLLQKLPSSTRNITLNNAKNVTLHGNRWECSCDSLWLPRWLSRHKSSLWMPGNIVCNYLKKPVGDITEIDLNCNTFSYVDTFLAVSLGLCSLVSTLVILFCYRTEINVLLFSKLGLRLGHPFSYGDLFSPYDAFVSYSQDNYKWVVDTLVPHLENCPQKYRLCLHYRDFPMGESVIDNIPWAIRLSRCSLLVLSKNFLKKEWCIMEVRAAFQRLLLTANKLIVIATDDLRVEDLSPDLQAYMNTHDYLRAGEPCFWEKLEMFLPPKNVSGGDIIASFINDGGGDSAGKPEQELPDAPESIGKSDNNSENISLYEH